MSKLLTAILLLAALSWSTFEIFDAHLDQARGRSGEWRGQQPGEGREDY